MEREYNSHVYPDDVSPSIMEGEICDERVEESLDFDDRESHPNTGLHRGEMRHARNDGMTNTAHSGTNGKRHQVRVQTWLCLRNIWEVIPTVRPVPQRSPQQPAQE